MDRHGVSLIEIVISLLLLSVGVLAYAGSAALVTRLTSLGRAQTVSARLVASRAEILADWARGTAPPCLDPRLASGSASHGPFRESWRAAPSGPVRAFEIHVSYPGPRGSAADTALGALLCPP